MTDTDLLELHALFPQHTPEDFSMVSLDGFFHGLACLPRVLPPSIWMDVVIPQEVLADRARLTRAFELIFRYQAKVSLGLYEEAPELYCDGSAQQIVHWLEGFAFAFTYDKKTLDELAEAELKNSSEPGEGTVIYAAIILAFALETQDAEQLDAKQNKERDKIAKIRADALNVHTGGSPQENYEQLLDFLMIVYGLLETARENEKNEPKPITRSQAKVGRNDPCPCGSGRKYKHCHGKN